MKIINTKTHAVLDYLVGILLIASPWLFRFSQIQAAKYVAMVIGLLILIYSLLTDYEGGLIKKIPMGVHLNLDIITGILLAVSPWVLGYHELVYLPHLIVGLLDIGVAMCTRNALQPTMAQNEYRNTLKKPAG